MSTPEGPPAGWYEDPSDKNRLRYWDGAAWDDDQAAAPQGGVGSEGGGRKSSFFSSFSAKASEPIDWSDKSNWASAAFLAVLALFVLSRCGGDEPAEPPPAPSSSDQPAAPEGAEDDPPEQDRNESEDDPPERVRNEMVEAPTAVVSFSAASAEILEVLFTVRNPEAVSMERVSCSVNAYVSTQEVARLFSNGGTIEDLAPGEQRRVRTSARIRNDQAASVTRVEVLCSSLLPENRPSASESAPGDAAGGDGDPAGDSVEDDPELSVEDVREAIMPLVFESSRADFIRIVADLFIVESVDFYDYDPATGTVTLDATPTYSSEDRRRDSAWELYRLFGMGLYGGDGDAWLVENPPFAPNLAISLASVSYECDGPTMRRIPEARLSRSQFEEECRVR